MKEIARTSFFIGAWIGAVIGAFHNIQGAIFIMLSLILWAVLEQSWILGNAIRELIRILKNHE
jgi:hypothetical protein